MTQKFQESHLALLVSVLDPFACRKTGYVEKGEANYMTAKVSVTQSKPLQLDSQE